MSNIWLASDHHVGHHNILEYTNRHEVWSSIEEMNEGLIANHNSVVAEDDIVYFLGDFAMGKIAETLPIAGRFNGKKRLYLGNHDRPFPKNKNASKWFEKYDVYFEDIRIHDTIEIDSVTVELNHFPYSGDSSEGPDRYPDFRPIDEGLVLLHGHCHSPLAVYGPRMVHVGVDADWTKYGVNRYHPIPLEAVAELIRDNS